MLRFLFAQKLERGHFYRENVFREAFEAEYQSELGPVLQTRAPFWRDEGTAQGKGSLAVAMGRRDGVGDALGVSRGAVPTRGRRAFRVSFKELALKWGNKY